MDKIKLKTSHRVELVDITDKIQDLVFKSKINEGLCCIFCPHTTGGLTINENADPSVKQDMIHALNKLIPDNVAYLHEEGNSDGHIKSSLFGVSLTVIIENGILALGAWQGIYFCENDGPRSREVWVKAHGR